MYTIIPVGGNAKLSVLRYTNASDLPANAKEGTVAVLSTVAIGAIHITADQPVSPVTGDVWIWIGGDSPAPIAINKSITVHPRAAYQWSGSAWVYKASYVFHASSWIEIGLMLYDYGEEVYDTISQYGPNGAGADDTRQYLTKNSGYMTLTLSTANAYANVRAGIVRAVDLTNIRTVQIVSAVSNGSTQKLQITGTVGAESAVAAVSIGNGTYNLDVSHLSGLYYIVVYGYIPNYFSGTMVLTVYKISLIK